MKRFTALAAAAAIFASGASAQTFFSVNAGTDGFNLNVTNVPPFYPVAVIPAYAPVHRPHRAAVCVPLRPGVEYMPVSPKSCRKAVKRARKAMRHGAYLPAASVMLPGGVVVGTTPAYYYDDDDDDDYEDWLEDQYKHYKKHHKHHKKHHKHHKHHHHDD